MESNRKYWVGFSRAAGIGAVRLRLLLDVFGDVATAWRAEEAALQASGVGPQGVPCDSPDAARRNLDESWSDSPPRFPF
jgi:hypothetical protein